MVRTVEAKGLVVLCMLILLAVLFGAYVIGDEGSGDPRANVEATPDLDLATDSNNNGTIESSEDEYEEYDSGRVVCLDCAGDGDGLEDLALVRLTIPPVAEGTITLSANGAGRVKVWKDAAKSEEYVLPKTWPVAEARNEVYVDGIEIGPVMLEMTYSGSAPVSPTSDRVALYVTDTISWAPTGNLARSWEPCRWPEGVSGRLDPVATDAALDAVKDQGWDVTVRWADQTGNDDDVGDCTLAHFKNMCLGGFDTICTHGHAGFIAGVYCLNQPKVNEWIAGEPGMSAERSDYGGYYAYVPSSWMRSRWKPTNNFLNAIVVMLSCCAAQDPDNVIQAAGGRVGFGNTGSHELKDTAPHVARLFGRMNGSLEIGQKRTAGKAYGDGSEYKFFKMLGNGVDQRHKWTTLCPAPSAVFPDGPVGNRRGSGNIIFDTYMHVGISADEAVFPEAGSGGISSRRWFGNYGGHYGVSFDFDAPVTWAATMIAGAAKCLNRGTIETRLRRLDGNRVKPNGDHKSWQIY